MSRSNLRRRAVAFAVQASFPLVVGCSSENAPSQPATPPPSACGVRLSTIAGSKDPRSDVNVSTSRADAVGALAVRRLGAPRVFCSGTLVTDRLVVTAAHCLMPSIYEAQGAKAPAAAEIEFIVGPDVANPRHVFDVAEVHLAPDAGHFPVSTQYGPDVVIVDDVAVLVLAESATAQVPELLPIPWNTKPLAQDVIGGVTVTGAYGGTACAPKSPSGPRGWAASRVTELDPRYLRVVEMGAGQFAHGDSGGGALMEFPDGSLRLVGVLSSLIDPKCESSVFHRVDHLDVWLRGIARDRLGEVCERDECGNVRCAAADAGSAGEIVLAPPPVPPRACGTFNECLGTCTELWCAHRCAFGTTVAAREKWSALYQCQACSVGLAKTGCAKSVQGTCVDVCKDGNAATCAPCFQAACKVDVDACLAD